MNLFYEFSLAQFSFSLNLFLVKDDEPIIPVSYKVEPLKAPSIPSVPIQTTALPPQPPSTSAPTSAYEFTTVKTTNNTCSSCKIPVPPTTRAPPPPVVQQPTQPIVSHPLTQPIVSHPLTQPIVSQPPQIVGVGLPQTFGIFTNRESSTGSINSVNDNTNKLDGSIDIRFDGNTNQKPSDLVVNPLGVGGISSSSIPGSPFQTNNPQINVGSVVPSQTPSSIFTSTNQYTGSPFQSNSPQGPVAPIVRDPFVQTPSPFQQSNQPAYQSPFQQTNSPQFQQTNHSPFQQTNPPQFLQTNPPQFQQTNPSPFRQPNPIPQTVPQVEFIDTRPNNQGQPPFQQQSADQSVLTGPLYKFNYTVGYHGHNEQGDRGGNKEGGYYSIGRDGYKRTVEYRADGNGYRPHTILERVQSDLVPQPETEKEKGLQGYEFKWFYLKR